jgi:Tol biopolymer transport system component
VPIIDHIAATSESGVAQYSVGSDGTLVYVPGRRTGVDSRIHLMTAKGETSPLKTTPGAWGNPRFSPDGRRIALQVAYGRHDQIAIYDLETDRITQLTFDAANHRCPAWTPDGRRIVYSSDADEQGRMNLYWRRADGSGNAERLTTAAASQCGGAMHPNGRSILYFESNGIQSSLWLLPLLGSPEAGWTAGTPRALGDGTVFEGLPALSPDGRLVAYMTNATGSFEVYVKPLEGAGGPWRVSASGGAHPTWSKSKQELVFTTDDQLMAAPFKYDGRTFTAETPRPWSRILYTAAGPTRKYDLHPDGTRVVLAAPDTTGEMANDTVVFVLGFFEELRRLLPTGR